MARPSSSERLVRLLALPAWVDAHPGATLEQAGRHFGVSAEQLRQDVMTLWMTGLPGMAGGDLVDFDYQALEEDSELYLTQGLGLGSPVRLSHHEAVSLTLVLRVLRQVLASEPAGAAAVDQTLVALRSAMGEQVPGVEPASLSSDRDSGKGADHEGGQAPVQTVSAEVLRAVREALTRHHRLHLDYVSANDRRSSRDVDPLALDSDGTHLVLRAWCLRAKSERSFRLDRVLGANVLEAPSTHLRARRREPETEPRPEVTLSLAPTGRWLVEQIPYEQAHSLTGGRWQVQVRGRDEQWLVRLVLSAGRHLEQVSPSQVLDQARAAASQALRAYQGLGL